MSPKITYSAEAQQVLDSLVNRLKRKRRDEGQLSLRDLAFLMAEEGPEAAGVAGRWRRGSSSTLGRIFQGKSVPTWPMLESLLRYGLHVPEEAIRSEWRPLWVKLMDLVDPLDSSSEVSDSTAESHNPPAHGVGRLVGADHTSDHNVVHVDRQRWLKQA